jgi:hypothetical protein|tara:strand:- start:249 stop:533 length:285 start_codon:yes stop_codon:yes gene_type:complete
MTDRLSIGSVVINHKGKKIPTSVGSRIYELLYSGPNVGAGLRSGIVPAGYAHRPDLIANLFRGTPSEWWAICETNAIFDVFEQLNSGDAIKVPG